MTGKPTDGDKQKPAIPEIETAQCPGEKYSITPALCTARQRRHYEKCDGCPNKRPGDAPSTVLTGRVKS